MNNRKVIIIVIIFSIIILLFVGTYAFFTSEVSSSNRALRASTAKFSITLDVKGIYISNKLIPMNDNLAITGFNNGCIDVNDYYVCQVYSIYLENDSGTGQDERLLGTIKYNLSHIKNLSYMLIDENSNVYTGPTSIVSNSELSLGNYVNLRDGESKKFYLIIWLSDNGRNQANDDANGVFSASVTYTGITGDNLSSMITGTIN